ncbi:hypothetical protein BC351_07105 [Paenibacillus ferrarius]|uniref:Golvesin/Xly CBD-like domain-containing protein n=1 Tax=Paenibacillus ferrarius TaxID=1469647 RepID=A0A1V4HCF3_9BACL|nr:hypothetical protein [Paenibacillus ferrarius]OPH50423.1 hypothetical protein BC351_07105 [Paenibacillus ferrarius]
MSKVKFGLLSLLSFVLMVSVFFSNIGPGGSSIVQANTEIIVDNTDAALVGSWTSSTFKPNFYGTNYVTKPSGSGTAKVKWTPNVPTAGTYKVYYKLPDGASDRASNAPFNVHDTTGDHPYSVDERVSPSAGWVLLGSHTFGAGSAGYVELSDNANGQFVIADAVKFEYVVPLGEVIVDNTAATSTGIWNISTFKPNYYGSNYATKPTGTGAATMRWTPNLPQAGTYAVYYRIPDGTSDRVNDAPFTVHDASGDQTYYVNEQESPGGVWKVLGNHTFAAGNGGYVELSDNANGSYVIADAIKFGPAVPEDMLPKPPQGNYKIRPDIPKQTILGLGVEIQSDSIGSGNNGLPEKTTSVPHDLVPSEKTRFYNDMLKGFRYARLAMGLYFRGLTPDQNNIVERFPGQADELKEMIEQSGMEGVAAEYWSPAPYWKSNGSYIGGSLKQFDAPFLNEFGDALVRDIDYLESKGIPVVMWGLQNEPAYSTPYSSAVYTDSQYYNTFKIAAPKVKAKYPNMFIQAESLSGQYGRGSALTRNDPATLQYVDGWTWHKIGTSSNEQITNAAYFNANTAGKPVFNNEFEYLDNTTSVDKMMNTAQSIMNWMTFENSPTWFWLHALKPTYNAESEGYGLGLWRPADDTDFSKYSQIQPGHFDYIKTNWHAVAGFVKYMPWNSVRYQVDESTVQLNNRIMAWKTPEGKLVFALTNRGGGSYTFNMDLGGAYTLAGHRYDKNTADLPLGNVTGSNVSITLPGNSIEFWAAQ